MHKSDVDQEHEPLDPLPVAPTLFYRWYMDFAGPLETSRQAANLASVLYEHVFPSYGPPVTLVTDRDASFRVDLDVYLPQALAACRVLRQSANDKSPFELLYGAEPRMPSLTTPQLQMENLTANDLENSKMAQLEQMSKSRVSAQLRREAAMTLAKKRLTQCVIKYARKWCGPYIGTFKLKGTNGQAHEGYVHKNRIKKIRFEHGMCWPELDYYHYYSGRLIKSYQLEPTRVEPRGEINLPAAPPAGVWD
ncbi:hypothetical protein RI367_007303 [Sorochytrium milnesiophthora]